MYLSTESRGTPSLLWQVVFCEVGELLPPITCGFRTCDSDLFLGRGKALSPFPEAERRDIETFSVRFFKAKL